MSDGDRISGTCKWFNEEKGYGFLTADGASQDYFVHFRAIETPGYKLLTEGQRVTFVPSQGRKGMEAGQVRPESVPE